MNEMIERLARALYKAHFERGRGLAREWGPLDRFEKEMWMFSARAAIEAMRELPSDPGPRYTAGEYSRRTQEAMVDDILTPPSDQQSHTPQ